MQNRVENLVTILVLKASHDIRLLFLLVDIMSPAAMFAFKQFAGCLPGKLLYFLEYFRPAAYLC